MIYRFETFALDTDRFELRKDGVPIAVEPQVFTLLTLMVSNSDRLITKEEMNEQVWNGRIVSDAALSSRIKSVRQALDDDGKSQRLIRTVHGKGFRFVGELSSPVNDGAAHRDGSATLGGADQSPEGTLARPTIAVLPFANMSGDSEQEYFSDAITQDIISNLSKYRWLDVVARNMSFEYKGTSVHVRQVARDLGVSYVIEGSVRRSGKRIRVTAQLVDANTGSQKWSDRYDRDLEDVFAVQDEITGKIVARLEPEIGAAEPSR